ncbi:hypothetical protein BHF71_11140 [Vulcanibacillus modesticaldus]|uniref:Uncharacterized protein n=1 Tax=Vulcanibacillus modesticaldus TaxID=337097 RepID=A0A1D2YSP8_9BACI|nr:hypothetical protein [Vulcanibacillus modesticaldus]OEF97595.1 hypothetical protein BHF71_11140 [Vulcanibacillus modesticaldus]
MTIILTGLILWIELYDIEMYQSPEPGVFTGTLTVWAFSSALTGYFTLRIRGYKRVDAFIKMFITFFIASLWMIIAAFVALMDL